jgi:predicted ATPase
LYLKEISLKKNKISSWEEYPFNIPLIREFENLKFSKNVTFIVGENGSGKSTIIEAIATALGFNPEGGTKNFNFSTNESHSNLHQYLKLTRSFYQPKDGFFLRAESFFNVASNIEQLNNSGGKPLYDSYGGKSLHDQSHGESFLSVILNRFSEKGIFILDEPESALSPLRQMTLISRISQLVQQQSQFIIATHSPILLAYPNADIYQIENGKLEQVDYKDTESYQITKAFLDNPSRMLKELLGNQRDIDT